MNDRGFSTEAEQAAFRLGEEMATARFVSTCRDRERTAYRMGFNDGQVHPVAYYYSFLETEYPKI